MASGARGAGLRRDTESAEKSEVEGVGEWSD